MDAIKPFSKKAEIIVFSTTLVFLLAGTLAIASSEKIISLLYVFFSKIVFHRDFSIDKWLPTLQSFILIPVFVAIFFNVFLFHKHSDKAKIMYLTVITACVAFLVTYTVLVSMRKNIDSDLASETLLALECVHEKNPIPVGWRYSTELRILNTQLVSAPLFLLTSNWDIVRALTSLFSCAILFWSGWFLLSKLQVKKTWLKFWGSILVVAPWSTLHFFVIGWGNYYIPHIILAFVTLGVFVQILNGTSKNEKRTLIAFYILSFISGVSSIRYILNYQIPITLSILIFSYKKNSGSEQNCDIKSFFEHSNALKAGIIGLLLSGLGYIFNSVALQPIYNLSQWSRVTFNSLGDATPLDVFYIFLRSFGFQDNIAVFTPSGVINICVYITLAIFVANIIKALRLNIAIERKFLLIFTICALIFNTFVISHTEYIDRYFIPVLAYIIPCVIIFIDCGQLGIFRRYFAGTTLTLCILTSSFTSTQSYLAKDKNRDIYPVMDFLNQKALQDSDYAFGYSIREYANMITYFTKGKIEVAAVLKDKKYSSELDDYVQCMPKKFEEENGLTVSRYYKEKHNGKTFFMLSEKFYKNSLDSKVFETGTQIYNDGKYIVFEYKSQNSFLNSFED